MVLVELLAEQHAATLTQPLGNHMHPKVKFLTVVWGDTYIKRFASLALPSFLAPGNLPALAQATDLEVVIMTRQDDFPRFENHATFVKLRKICPVRFVAIDDLITTSVYGVTLTLAYARPIIACGREMLSTHFVFMNADFVLADGSLRSLCKHIYAGRSIVLGPSFRSTSEALEPILESAVDTATGLLTIPPRQLVKFSLAHPHPTTVAKMADQDFCHSTHPNQFFWQVDKQTILGRYYLIFMLCLKPERVIKTINCYCDYSFIPEMCPSGDEVVMDDSDDFFMLELQRRDQEMFMLKLGRAPDNIIANSLQYWTTAEHRRHANYDVVFHAGELPPGIQAAKTEARTFINRISRKLGRPLPHIGHKYWVHGVEAWRFHRRSAGLTASPPELTTDHGGFREWLSLSYVRFRMQKLYLYYHYTSHRVIPEIVQRTPLHPYWLDYRLLKDTAGKSLSAPNAHILVVRERTSIIDRIVGADARVRFTSIQEVLKEGPPPARNGSDGYTHALIYLLRKDCRNVQRLVKKCRASMRPGATYDVVIHHWLGEIESGNFSSEIVSYLEEIVGWRPRGADCWFVGGSLKRFNAKLLLRLSRHYSRFGKLALLWILLPLTAALTLTLIGNLYLSFKMPRRNYIDYCSSAAIRLNPIDV